MDSMMTATVPPTFEIIGSVSEGVAADAPASDGGGEESPFGQVVALYRSNSSLLSELTSVPATLSGAGGSLAGPACTAALGRAHLLRLRARHSAALVLLRANRLQARRLLARTAGATGTIPLAPRGKPTR